MGNQRRQQKSNKKTLSNRQSNYRPPQISPQKRAQLEAERKQRQQYEDNFTCKIDQMSDQQSQILMEGSQIKNKQVTFGMINKGNTCFFNSVMQSFMHTIPLQQYAFIGEHKKFCQQKGGCILCTYIDFTQRLIKDKRAPVDMMIKFIHKCVPRYKFGKQEDAQEFITGLLDQFIKACFAHKEPVYKFVINHQQKTPIFKIFGFTARSQILCESCGYQSNTYSQKCDLNLHIPKKRGVTFQDCLNEFVSHERLSGENKYQCDGCKLKVNAQKSWSIETAPRILMVNFVRSMLGKKNKEIIPYPKKFNLKNYMSQAIDAKSGAGSTKQIDDQIYDLYSIIVHEGSSTHSGHYYSYNRSLDTEKWYDCNDSYIGKLNGIDDVLRKTQQQTEQENIEKLIVLEAAKKAKVMNEKEVEAIKQTVPEVKESQKIINKIEQSLLQKVENEKKNQESKKTIQAETNPIVVKTQENGPEDASRKRMKIKIKPVLTTDFQFTSLKKRLHPLSRDFSTTIRKTMLLSILSSTKKFKNSKLPDLPTMLRRQSSILVPSPSIPINPALINQQKMKKI